MKILMKMNIKRPEGKTGVAKLAVPMEVSLKRKGINPVDKVLLGIE
jgi:hypothetical protein